jgi:hypothetical protein
MKYQRFKTHIYYTLALLCFSTITMFATSANLLLDDGENVDISPIEAGQQDKIRLGGFIGVNAVFQTDSLRTLCNCPGFINGRGSGLLIGAFYEPNAKSDLLFGGAISFDQRSFSSSYISVFDTTISSLRDPSIRFENQAISQLHTANVSLGYLFITPYVKWYPFGQNFFVRLGASAGVLLSQSLEHLVEFNNPLIRLPNSENVVISVREDSLRQGQTAVNSTTVRQPDRGFSDINRFQFGLLPSIGAELKLTANWWLAPTIQYAIPMTTITSNAPYKFSVSALQFVLEVHHTLIFLNR